MSARNAVNINKLFGIMAMSAAFGFLTGAALVYTCGPFVAKYLTF